jgi:Zn-dependent peptidase ImmA (M78 family)
MIELQNAKRTCYGSVQVSDKDLEDFAYKQLNDYQKDYFKKPHALNVDDFIEFYLGIKIQFYVLSIDGSILGKTALSNGKICIINEKNEIDLRTIEKGSIIIDSKACKLEVRIRFTAVHEAFHSQYDLDLDQNLIDKNEVIQDTHITIGKAINVKKTMTALDWVEHHADKYAVFILMPKKFVITLFNYYHKKYFSKNKRLSIHKPKRTWLLITSIAKDLCVSEQAMAYRLKELKLISLEIFKSLKLGKNIEGNIDF